MYREVFDGDPSTNNASESWVSASKLDTIKIDKSLAQYKIFENVQGSGHKSHINIIAAYSAPSLKNPTLEQPPVTGISTFLFF